MTRINLVDPTLLVRQHLTAEHYELPRVFSNVLNAQGKGLTPRDFDIPTLYTMGRGHMTFFYDKLMWLNRRWWALSDEMLKRGYSATHPADWTLNIHPMWWGEYQPSLIEVQVNVSRINLRLIQMEPKGQRSPRLVGSTPCSIPRTGSTSPS